MYKVMIETSVYDVFYERMKKGLEHDYQKDKSYLNIMRTYIQDLTRISETLKYNPYSYPELVTGYRYVLDFDFKPIYKIEDDKVWIVDFISYERWNEAYQSYLTNKNSNGGDST